MTCKDDKTYPYPVSNVFGNGSLLTVYNGCGYQGITASDFLEGAELGLLGGLVDFPDGTVLMVVDGNFVESGFRYDSDLDALVYDGKIIADELEVSTDTISISQRLAIEAFGNSVEFKDTFNNDRRLPIYTKVNEQGSLGNFFAQVGAEQPIVIQDLFDVNNTNANYSPPDTPGQATSSNVSRGHYRFSESGVNARIRVIATNQDGERFVQFGTEAYPFKEFVSLAYNGTEASETIVVYPAGIYNTEGLTYETYIETFDPETREASGEPLNILGTTDNGIFRAYVVVDFQIVTEIELAGGGDVVASSASQVEEIPMYTDSSGRTIGTSGQKLSDYLLKSEVEYKQSINIIANTVDIYAPNDLYNHFFYIGAAPAAIKLKNPNAEYSEQDRFEVFNDSGYTLVITDIDDNEIQIVQSGQAYEFFYLDGVLFTGWKVETLRTRSRNVVEYDVSIDSTPTLGPAQVGPLISITQSGNITIPMVFSLEAFDNFKTGDVIEISTSDSYTNYFFGVLYTSSIGQQLVVYPNKSCRLMRTDSSWDVQQDGTFVRTGIRTSTSRNTPLEPDGSAMVPVNGISIIDSPDDIATYIQDDEGHRVLQLDFTAIPAFPEGIDYRFGVNNWYDNGPAAEYQQSNPIQFLEMECHGGYVNQVVHQGYGYTTYLRVYPGDYNTTKSVEFKDSESRVSGRRTVRVGETWKVTSAQKDSDADVYYERIDDGTEPSGAYDGEGFGVPGKVLVEAGTVVQTQITGNYRNNSDAVGDLTINLRTDDGVRNFKFYYNIPKGSISARKIFVKVDEKAGTVKTINSGETWQCEIKAGQFFDEFFWSKVMDSATTFIADEAGLLIDENNDEIITPNQGAQFQLIDADKSNGYGDSGVITYYGPNYSTGQASVLVNHLANSKSYFVHKETGSSRGFAILHQSYVSQIYNQDVAGVSELTMLFGPKSRGRYAKSNQVAPAGMVLNWNGDYLPDTEDPNDINPTSWIDIDGNTTTEWSKTGIKTACYSVGLLANDGSALLQRGDVFCHDDAGVKTSAFTADSDSEFFVIPIKTGGGTFNDLRLFPLFMSRFYKLQNEWDSYTFDNSADCVGTILKIAYDAAVYAEDANAILEAAKTSSDFSEFKQKLEDTTITETL